MMIKLNYLILLSSFCIISFCCTASKQFILEKPQEGKCLLVGAVLIENNGVEELYQAITENVTVVLVGKSMENGEEKEEGYRVKTDENGYFLVQNVPPGAYVLKGFEVDIGFGRRLFISSRWDGNKQIFYPEETIIDYTVRVWPESKNSKILDMEITYFMIDQALRIANNEYKKIQNMTGVIKGSNYTMANPADYFHAKYPQGDWFESL
jgi:hypothetical protein